MIRKAIQADLDDIFKVIQAARARMRAGGNLTQWENGYPEKVLEEDIGGGNLYVLCGEDGAIHAAFAFIIGEDETYRRIEDGAWLSDAPYGTIHRIAGNGTKKGILAEAVTYCESKIPHLRIDTHRNNHIMQHLIEKHGFRRCGTIYISDGSPRIAYEKIPEGLLPVY